VGAYMREVVCGWINRRMRGRVCGCMYVSTDRWSGGFTDV
jgi:hypothetical protein